MLHLNHNGVNISMGRRADRDAYPLHFRHSSLKLDGAGISLWLGSFGTGVSLKCANSDAGICTEGPLERGEGFPANFVMRRQFLVS